DRISCGRGFLQSKYVICRSQWILRTLQSAILPSAWSMLYTAIDHSFGGLARHYSSPTLPAPELPALFAELQAMGLKLGVATNDNTASAHAAIEQLGIGDWVDFVAGYDSVSTPKPAPDMVLAFCAACAVTPDQVLLIGDTLTDMETGHEAKTGLKIGVLSGNGTAAGLMPRADALLADVGGLPAFLAGKTGAARR
ncbi:MAG: HAD family hydrolase, partial [Hyphomicrobiales bacterium]